jgi:hypothetical protein
MLKKPTPDADPRMKGAWALVLQAQETQPLILEAVATKVMDRWVVDVLGSAPFTVRVKSLDDIDAVASQRLRSHRSRLDQTRVRVHVYWYR